MIAILEKNVNDVPNPPPGKIRIFADESDGQIKAKKENGAVVSLEEAALGIGNAADINYNTDPNFWLWSVSVPSDVKEALDLLAQEVRDIGDTVDAISPERAPLLGNLVPNITLFTAVIPSGLPARWYTEQSAGDIINNAVYNNFVLGTGFFRAGRAGDQSTFGILSKEENGVLNDIYDISTLGAGTQDDITISSLQDFNTLWNRADADIDTDFQQNGFNEISVTHTEAGTSNEAEFHYDDNTDLPFFVGGVTLTEFSVVPKYLSGILYYGLNSTFRLSFTAGDLFKNLYRNDGVARITASAVNPFVLNPSSVPQVTDNFTVINRTVTLNSQGVIDFTPELVVTLRKPNNANAANIMVDMLSIANREVDTTVASSTDLFEEFVDEDRRLSADASAPFDSVSTLPNGEALVRNSRVSYGDDQYPSKSGDQRYDRYIVKPFANNGGLTFGGFNPSNISPVGTGSINIVLQLEDEGVFFDLGRAFGDNSNGNGSSINAALGGRVSIAGNTLNFTFGTFSTANNSSRFRMIIIFRNNTHSINSITAI